MRRATWVITSSVASSAQWQSSTTQTPSAASNAGPSLTPMSRSGPSGCGTVRSSQAPHRTSRPVGEGADERGLADPGLAGHHDDAAALVCGGVQLRQRLSTLEQLHCANLTSTARGREATDRGPRGLDWSLCSLSGNKVTSWPIPRLPYLS